MAQGTKGRTYKHIREEDYKRIKLLINADLPPKTVCELTGRSRSTVLYIKQSKDFADYQRIIREALQRSRDNKAAEAPRAKSVEVPRQDEEKESTVAKNFVPQNEFRTLQALNRIGDQLERLADAWEASPKKKFF